MKTIALLTIAAGFAVLFFSLANGVGSIGIAGAQTVSMIGLAIVIVGTGFFVSAGRGSSLPDVASK